MKQVCCFGELEW